AQVDQRGLQITKGQDDAAENAQDTQDTGNTKAGDHEEIQKEEQKAHQEEQNGLPAQEPRDVAAAEEEAQTDQPSGPWHSPTRRGDFKDHTEKAQSQKERADGGVGEETGDVFRPVGL